MSTLHVHATANHCVKIVSLLLSLKNVVDTVQSEGNL